MNDNDSHPEDEQFADQSDTPPDQVKETAGAVTDAFKDLKEHDSTPSVPFSDVQKVRFSKLAEDLKDARIQAYVQANFGIQALKLLQQLIPLIAGI